VRKRFDPRPSLAAAALDRPRDQLPDLPDVDHRRGRSALYVGPLDGGLFDKTAPVAAIENAMRCQQSLTTAVALLGALAGCSYTQVYRGAFSGKIVDPGGRPISGAKVIVCTSAHPKSPDACSFRDEASTDFEGRFQFWPVTKEKSCCFSGSPLPPTHLTACARDTMSGHLMTASVTVDTSGTTEPKITLARPNGRWLRTTCDAPM
jgi:hypothetical protein